MDAAQQERSNHVASTSRGSSAYPRKRAVTACQVCRARRTKCDQKKPKCSFCERTGAECVLAPTDSSSFDPASLAIIERLERMERKLDAAHVNSTHHPVIGPSPARAQAQATSGRPVHLDNCLPENLDAVLSWPIFEGHRPALNSCSPFSDQSQATISQWGHSTSFLLGEELSPAACTPWLDNFFSQVHVKNPVLDEDATRALVRRVCVEGPGWDGQSCLALLVCANGALARPFSKRSVLQQDLDGCIAMALYSAAQKRFGTLFVSAGVIEAQCALFAGVFLMSVLRPVDAWRMFLQGLAICQGLNHDSAEEGSIYWSCWKSEQELRWELGISSLGHVEPPRRFPTLPNGCEDQTLHAWYFYLSEISLWRLETKAKTEICKLVQECSFHEEILEKLADLGDSTIDQVSSWRESLAPPVSLEGSPYDEDVLRFVLRGRATYVHELISWPFIRLIVEGHQYTSRTWQWATKGLSFHLERILINSTGFYHRHHGTWLMLRSSARSAFILLACATIPSATSLLPSGWRAAVDATLEMIHFWATEIEAVTNTAQIMQQMLTHIDSAG